MPIAPSDIIFALSGGAANSNPDNSLGGAVSSTAINSGQLHNLFDKVGGDESAAGDTEYRCLYVKNDHATLTLENAKIYLQTQTDSPDTSVELGLGAAAVGATETAIADESTAPADVTFVSNIGTANALDIGNIGPGQAKSVFVKRIVNQGAAAYNNDSLSLAVVGETAA